MTGASRSTRAVLAVPLLLFVLAGCAKGDSDVRTVSTKLNGPAVTEPGPAPPPTSAGRPDTLDPLGTEIVYGGLEIAFDDVAFTPDPNLPGTGSVVVTMRITNTTSSGAASPTMLLQVGSEELTGYFVDSYIDAAETRDTSIEFTNVTGAWSAAASVLVVGALDENRAEVPLDGSDPTFVRPTEAEPLTGSGSIPDRFAVYLQTVSVRGDFEIDPKQAPDGKVVVAVELQARTPSAAISLSGDNFRLRPPDGAQISPEAARFGDERECCIVLERDAPVDGALYFAVPEPGTGDYVLVLREGDTTAEAPFTVTG